MMGEKFKEWRTKKRRTKKFEVRVNKKKRKGKKEGRGRKLQDSLDVKDKIRKS